MYKELTTRTPRHWQSQPYRVLETSEHGSRTRKKRNENSHLFYRFHHCSLFPSYCHLLWINRAGEGLFAILTRVTLFASFRRLKIRFRQAWSARFARREACEKKNVFRASLPSSLVSRDCLRSPIKWKKVTRALQVNFHPGDPHKKKHWSSFSATEFLSSHLLDYQVPHACSNAMSCSEYWYFQNGSLVTWSSTHKCSTGHQCRLTCWPTPTNSLSSNKKS